MFPRASFGGAITDIQSLLSDADPATADLDDATRAWLARTRQEITAQQRAPGRRRAWAAMPHRAPGPRRRMLAAAGALAVAATLAAVTVVALLPATTPGASPAAVRLLAKIATAAAGQPAPPVRNSQFWYIKSWVAYQGCKQVLGNNGVLGKPDCVMGKPHERQIWQSVSNLCVTGLLREHGQDTPFADSPGGKCPDRGGLNDPTYRLLQTLPTDPHALLAMIYRVERGRPGPGQEAFVTIGDLLREAIAPPQVSVALYRAAALIPGVTVIADATDAIGRHGVAVAMTIEGARNEWIFSKQTLRYLGERDINIAHGSTIGAAAVLQRAFVNRAGQIPG
jgi:hypothetical protein